MVLGCSEKQPKIKSDIASSHPFPSHTPMQNSLLPITGNTDICSNISNYISANFPQFKEKSDLLCSQNFLATLRNPSLIYRDDGSQVPPIVNQTTQVNSQDSKLSDKQSSIKMSTSMILNTDPKSYFNMIRLQISRPEDFKGSAQFESDNNTEITTYPTKVNFQQAEYHLIDLTDKPDTIVEYDGISKFIPLVKEQLYLILTEKKDGKYETLAAFKNLTLIHLILNSNSNIEVFSVSENLIDSGGDHEESVRKARRNVAHSMERNLRNSRRAQNANKYFND